jgi:hypothetical protein
VFKNPKPELMKALEDAGLSTENGVRKMVDSKNKKKGKAGNVSYLGSVNMFPT